MRVLVFAASSFIGQHLCRALEAQGCNVIRTRRVPNNASYLACDLMDGTGVARVVQETAPEAIIQCGAATSSRDPRELYQTHVFGTLNLMEAVERYAPAARVILMGSAAEYGSLPIDWLPLTEDRLPQPSSAFGASKLAQTQLAQALAQEKKLKIACVRPFNVLGPGLPDIYFATSLAKRLLTVTGPGTRSQAEIENECASNTTKEFEVTNASATRDFVDVRDVARACWALLERAPFDAGRCEVFNIATQRETTLLEMAQCLGELAGGQIPKEGGSHQSRGGINRSCGSYEKLARTTSWEPQISWQQSVTDLFHSLLIRSGESATSGIAGLRKFGQ